MDVRPSKPTFCDFASVVYDKRTVTIKDRYCTLATVNGRVRADYVLGDYQKEHLDDPNYEMRSATLSYRDGMFFLNITIRKPVLYKSTGIVMGVDLGVDNIAVTSTGKFFDAGFYNWKRNGYFRTKRGLQDKGTRVARRVLKRLKRRENRFTEDHIHCVSKAIVQEALDHNVDTIVFEQLDHIRDRMQNGNNRTPLSDKCTLGLSANFKRLWRTRLPRSVFALIIKMLDIPRRSVRGVGTLNALAVMVLYFLVASVVTLFTPIITPPRTLVSTTVPRGKSLLGLGYPVN
ncbi:MAG: transposase [Anaerolineales bacterium]